MEEQIGHGRRASSVRSAIESTRRWMLTSWRRSATGPTLAIYDRGRTVFLGASRSIRFVERAPDGTQAFVSEVDCLFCRRQPAGGDEDDGRAILAAMARVHPRDLSARFDPFGLH